MGPLGTTRSSAIGCFLVGLCSHLCPRDVGAILWRLGFENSDRKFGRANVGRLLTIEITAIGCLFGRATSLGDRRLLFVRSDFVAISGSQVRSCHCWAVIYDRKSQRLDACSDGLRRSEIDGHFGRSLD